MKRLLLAPLAALALVACNPLDNDSSNPPPEEPTPAATETAEPAATATPSAVATSEPAARPPQRPGAASSPVSRAQDLRDEAKVGGPNRPVEKAATSSQPATLKQVAIRGQENAQAVTFEFAGTIPGYRVEYVASPAHCGSGKPLPLPAGASALVVRFEPATAHDASGKLTVANTVVEAAGPHILGATQLCDFEGVVTWAIAVKEKGPFAVSEAGGRVSVVVGAK